jgi:hypothetical protein
MNTLLKRRKKMKDDELDRWRGESPAAGRYTQFQETQKKENESKFTPVQRREVNKT